MNLDLDFTISSNYTSNSQRARVTTEKWVDDNVYCPFCGKSKLLHLHNNMPVADFLCEECSNEFELKSKKGQIFNKILDGGYWTMIERIRSNNNPSLFVMSYSLESSRVDSLTFVPKYFFTPDIIERRKPLSANAKRAGWIGCNILFNSIPRQGRIQIVYDGYQRCKKEVLMEVKAAEFFKVDNLSNRGWMFDVLNIVNQFQTDIFTLSDVYSFELELASKYPMNNNIRPKIRQQLQILRDRGIVEFLGKGNYSLRNLSEAV